MNRRNIKWAALVVAGVLFGYYAFVSVFASSGPNGETSSSYGTVPGGVSAWAELLRRRGHPVTQGRESLAENPPAPNSTLILVDGAPLEDDEIDSVERFVRDGGRVVLAGAIPIDLSAQLLDDEVAYKYPGDRVMRPLAPAFEITGVRRTVGSGEGVLTDSGSALPLLGGRRGVGVAYGGDGRGRVLLVADPSPLRNRFLARADNAVLALDLAGSPKRPVQFVETIHGYGRQSGLSALPSRWKTAISLLVLAGLIFLFARGKRFGPTEQRDRKLPPPRGAYADALAATLEKTKDRDAAIEPIHAAARRQVAHRAGLGPEPDPATVEMAAKRLGLSDDEARAVAADEDFDMIATGRALARLNGGTEK